MAVESTMNADTRRVVYGLNVVLNIVLAIAVAAFAIWAATRFGGQIDVTRSGVNSLSPRTVALLEGLEEPITLTGLYSTTLKEVRPYAEKHKNRVADLLDLYETAAPAGKVRSEMIDASEDPAAVEELLKRLAQKPAYQDESKPHAEVLKAFPETNGRILSFLQEEATRFSEIRNKPELAQVSAVGIIERNLMVMTREASDANTTVTALLNEEIPRYGRAVETVRSYAEQLRQYLLDARDWMTNNGANIPGLSEESREFFANAQVRYQDAVADTDALIEQTKDLKAVALEDLWEKLKRDQTVLVETPEEALVLTHNEVWPFRTERDAPTPPDNDPSDFTGEQAISSAILRLTQTAKTAVVFVRFGGMPLLAPMMDPSNPAIPMAPPPLAMLKEALENENFLTAEWDVKASAQPPTFDEEVARTAYVVFPPTSPEQTNPMRPPSEPGISAEQKQLIYDAVRNSGMAIFLASWQRPAMQFSSVPGQYAFTDYLHRTWGIDVEDQFLAMEFLANPQAENKWMPANRRTIVSSRRFTFTEHPIGKPLRGMPAGFEAAVPLGIATGDDIPSDVTVEPIVVVDDTEDVWGIKNLDRLLDDLRGGEGTIRYDDDKAAPFPLALAAERKDDGRVVVLASQALITDSVLGISQAVLIGGTITNAQLFPGNLDLFVNSLHWLTGDADRIAVGPQRGEVPRLSKLKDDGTLTFTRVFLVGIWPSLALLAGLIVWIVRRR